MELSKLLNDRQYEGATCTSQYTRVIAGAGSGKTRVLTYRIAYLIDNLNVPPYSIIAWTFTNKAAKEIKERVINVCGGENVHRMFLGTIHSWCANFLRHEAEYINYPKSFTILDDEDQLSIMKYIFNEKHGLPKSDPNIKKCLDWIGKKKCDGYEYYDLKDQKYPNQLLNDFLQYFKEYTEICIERHSLDFDDLLLKTIDVLRDCPEVRERYTRYIDHILIDEFQDINDVQFKLVTLLMNKNTSLYVVGDPDQTIYTWRGANHKLIMELEDNIKYFYKGAKVNTIILDRNYRSTKNILNISNKLINNNVERVKKDLYSLQEDGDAVQYFNARTQKEEAMHVITSILDLHKKQNIAYKDIAILYRANYLTRELESSLGMFRIPYKVFGGMKFYQRKEIKDIVAYFRLIVNQFDDTSFDRIINVPKRGIGPGTVEKLYNAANNVGQTAFIYMKENLNESPLSSKQKASWANALEQMRIVQNEIALNNRKLSGVLEEFVAKIGYFDYLKEEDEESKADERKENIKELISYVDGFLLENEEATFEDFVNNAMLQSAQDDVNEGDFVSLMTVHTAKGLEFDYVFVYGLCDGVFPSQKSVVESKKGIEEERRLAYVAFTRARKKLWLTSNQDYSYIQQCPLTPSRFIKEVGLEKKMDSRFSYEMGSSSTPSYQKPIYKAQGFVKKDISAKPIILSSQTNGVTDWKVGDRANHSTYGDGDVVEIIDRLIVIKFDDASVGRKTFLGSHVSIKKIGGN